METPRVFDEGCLHCRHNPNAEKPYEKMKRIRMENLDESEAQKEADRTGQKVDCVVCRSAQTILDTLKPKTKDNVRVWIEREVYEEIERAAREKNETVEEYVIDLVHERYEKLFP